MSVAQALSSTLRSTVMIAVLLAGCATGALESAVSTVPASCAVDGDCEEGERCDLDVGRCVSVDAGMDAGRDGEDVADGQGDAADVAAPDAADRGIGESCAVDGDCPSGYCISVGPGPRVCTDFCTEGSCPEGWACNGVVNGGQDAVFLCFPEVDTLCAPCASDLDCGGLDDRCAALADGMFCGRSCVVRACPEGFDCVAVEGGAAQCRPSAAVSCTGCVDGDGDGYGAGASCLGLDCDDGDGRVNPGAIDLCDGVDNDCDGMVDEGLTNACGTCGPAPEEVCDGVDNDCDGEVDEGVKNVCGTCGEPPAEVCDGLDNDCNGTVDDAPVCGAWVQSRCRLFVGWADNEAGPAGASASWGVCPAADRVNSGNVRCVGTRREGNFARLQLPGDVNGDDEAAVALLCDDGTQPEVARWVQGHCALYLGHADSRLGVDRSPTWGDCPAAAAGDDGRLRCTSTGYDGLFRAMRLAGDVDSNDQLGVAWLCRDDADPARAASVQASVDVFLGWADSNGGPADGSATWGPCPGAASGEVSGRRCTSTQGDGRFHLILLGGDVDSNDQLGWSLRGR